MISQRSFESAVEAETSVRLDEAHKSAVTVRHDAELSLSC